MTGRWVRKLNESDICLFGFFFIIFCFYLGLIQLVLLPFVFPAFHETSGIMKGASDTLYFHGLALDLLEKMNIHGWDAWQINYKGQSPAGIAAAFYYIFTPRPFVLIPFTAFAHSLSGVMLLKTMRLIFCDSRLFFFAVLPFLLMPSTTVWLVNFHRDPYFILGFFMVIYAHTLLFSDSGRFSKKGECLLWFAVGGFLVWLARPYALDIIAVLSVVSLLCLGFRIRNSWVPKMVISIFISVILLFLVMGSEVKRIKMADPPRPGITGMIQGMVEKKFTAFAKDRDRFNRLTEATGSSLDTDLGFFSLSDVMAYVPRALQIALFAPFPGTWFEKDASIFKRGAAMEMILFYIAYGSFFLMCIRKKLTITVVPALIFALGLVLFQGLVVSNVGALYRMRYGAIMIFVTLPLAYLCSEPVKAGAKPVKIIKSLEK
ncbi:hypothetical protein [Desulfotignum balticum]|uniref:hypothetical protein n=1 Tax=Desulfotignum balticum TaxID=115781 RepID=UPI00041C98C5|nr:hypothetical protein [Desulfotignum balticum]